MTASSITADAPPLAHRSIRNWWPTVLGLAVAAVQLSTGPDTDTVASVTGVAVLCYLAAAALRRRWAAWAGCFVFPTTVAVCQVVGVTWWVVLGVMALALVVVGLLVRASRRELTAQGAALIVYGGAAVAALFLEPRLGIALAGVGLVLHAGWDIVHYRRNAVVHRSLTEFCVMLDVPVGIGAIVLAIVG